MAVSPENDTLLWEPTAVLKEQAIVTDYMRWLKREKGLIMQSRGELWQWSVDHLEDFWASLWEYFHINASNPYTSVLKERKMPGAQWFSGAELSYAEHMFRHATSERPALIFQAENRPLREVSWDELHRKTGAI